MSLTTSAIRGIESVTSRLFDSVDDPPDLKQRTYGLGQAFTQKVKPGVKAGFGILKILAGGIGTLLSWSLAGVVGEGKFDKVLKWGLAPLCILFAGVGAYDVATFNKKKEEKIEDKPLGSIIDLKGLNDTVSREYIDALREARKTLDPNYLTPTASFDSYAIAVKPGNRAPILDINRKTYNAINAIPALSAFKPEGYEPTIDGLSNIQGERKTLSRLRSEFGANVGEVIASIPAGSDYMATLAPAMPATGTPPTGTPYLVDILGNDGIPRDKEKYFNDEFIRVYNALRQFKTTYNTPKSLRDKILDPNINLSKIGLTQNEEDHLKEIQDLNNSFNALNGAIEYVRSNYDSTDPVVLLLTSELRGALIAGLRKTGITSMHEFEREMKTLQSDLKPLLDELQKVIQEVESKISSDPNYPNYELASKDHKIFGRQIKFSYKRALAAAA